MKPELHDGAPIGTVRSVSESGCMNSEVFRKYLQHVISHVKPSPAFPVLLVLDVHSSHTNNLDALDLARKTG